MDKITISTTGFAELDAALGELKQSTGRAVLRRAGTKALTPMMEHAAALAPDDPKTPPTDLHTSFAISERQKSGRQQKFTLSPDSITLYMGPTKGGYPEALPQEFGWVEHGKHYPGKPYMRPAWDSGAEKLLDDVKDELTHEIEKAAARAAAKAARAAVVA